MTTSKHRCKHCKNYERVEFMVRAPAGEFCSEDCKVAWSIEQVKKKGAANILSAAKRKEKTIADKPFKEMKAKARLNDLPHQLELTQKVFNTMIRLLDRGKRCPTCAEPLVEGQYDAGHVRTVASCPQLRLSAAACFGQCRKCNGSGTIRRRTKKTQEVVSDLYKAWVMEALGEAHYAWLYGPHPSPKWTATDMASMRSIFAEEVRRLLKNMPPSQDWRRLPEP